MKQKVFGFHAVESILRFRPNEVSELYVLEGRRDARFQALEPLIAKATLTVQTKPRKILDDLAETTKHQGIVLLGRFNARLNENDLLTVLDGLDHPPFLLVLDGIEDPRNLGACLRAADGAGVDAVIVPKNRGTEASEVTRKVAAGAFDSLPLITVSNLARVLDELKSRGIWLVGLAGEATQSLYEVDLKGPIALLLGNEGEGLRSLTKKTCDHLAYLPMQGYVSSLNVAVATGVTLYEALRQRP